MKYDQITVTQRYSTHLSLGGVKQPDCTNSYATSIYSSLADIIAMLGQILYEHNESQVHPLLVDFKKDKPTSSRGMDAIS
jgi:hypothetical protein